MYARSAFFAAVTFAAAACGGASPSPTQPTTSTAGSASAAPASAATTAAPSASAAPSSTAAPSGTATTALPSGGVAWKDMDHDARLKFMKDTVIPRMGALFTGFDGTRFAKVTCITCHGSSAKTGNFDMPNPELPKLSFTPGAQHHDPAMMKFMSEQVEVHMAQLLSEQPFDMQTKQGFGCLDCHTKAN